MGYYIRKIKNKKSLPHWKLQFVSCKKVDQKPTSKAKNPTTTWDISKDRWKTLGFHKLMTLDEAKERARQLNLQLEMKRQEAFLLKTKIKNEEIRIKHSSVLPEEFVLEFERRFVIPRSHSDETNYKRRKKQRYTHWKAAQKLIVFIGKDPLHWFYHTKDFYDFFFQKKYSIGYSRSILKMANLWGYFISRKIDTPFLEIPSPYGYERKRIIEASYEKKSNRSFPSKPVTPEQLIKIKNQINQLNFNWLYLSVWLGLRPQEIDNLKNSELWRTEKLPTGREVLWVYQTKIIALPPEERWKPIPLLFDEQSFILQIINGGKFKRPLVKTVNKYLGKGHNLYGGRKGFVDLMLSKNQSLNNISIWMGHSTLNRTWRSYKNKQLYHI